MTTVKQLLKKYDTDQSGTLDHAQLKGLMTDMNQGVGPSDSEVNAVFARADKSKTGALLKSEVLMAAVIWGSKVKVRDTEKKKIHPEKEEEKEEQEHEEDEKANARGQRWQRRWN